MSTISNEVDDLICSLYTPMNVAQAAEHGTTLASITNQLLSVNKTIATEDDKNWIDLLSKAVEHNLQNLQLKCSDSV